MAWHSHIAHCMPPVLYRVPHLLSSWPNLRPNYWQKSSNSTRYSLSLTPSSPAPARAPTISGTRAASPWVFKGDLDDAVLSDELESCEAETMPPLQCLSRACDKPPASSPSSAGRRCPRMDLQRRSNLLNVGQDSVRVLLSFIMSMSLGCFNRL